ncbi:MAG: ParB/RepB/Spo0J family partition protein, partial [Dictyoglomus sp.]
MSFKKKGLGRGLEALIGEEEGHLVENIPIDKIVPNPKQPRETLNPETLQELIESIKTLGLLQPILVRPKGEMYEIVAGERRYHAAKVAGLKEIPVIVKNIDDQTAWDIALTENLQKED